MKIRSCEIGSFGKLHDRTVALDDRITVIHGKNESGKSTLSAFIKYVLYGYTGRGSDERVNEKLHYAPWDGAPAKGALVLETKDGELYRAERSSAGRGTAKILNSAGTECFDGQCAGEALYRVDAATFAKSAFVGQLDIEGGGMEGLDAGIEKSVLEGEDGADAASADKELKAARNLLYNQMRKTGRIFELGDRLVDLRTRLSSCTENHKELLDARFGIHESERRIAENEEHLAALYAERDNLDAYAAQEKLDEIARARSEKDACEKAYGDAREAIRHGETFADAAFLHGFADALADYSLSAEKVSGAAKDAAAAKAAFTARFTDNGDSHAFEEAEKQENFSASDLKAETVRAVRGRKLPLVFGVILAVAAVAAALVSYFALHDLAAFGVCLGAGAVLLAAGLLLSARARKRLSALLAAYGFDSVEKLLDFAARYDTEKKERQEAKTALADAKTILRERERENDKAAKILLPLLGALGIDALPDAEQAEEIRERRLPDMENSAREADAAHKRLAGAETTLNVLLSCYDVDELEKTRAKKRDEPPARASEVVEREIQFLETANLHLQNKLNACRTQEARLDSVTQDPALLAREIELAEDQLSDASLHKGALDLAVSLIEKAGESIRSRVLPSLAEEASALFSRFTDGKYRKLYFDSDFHIRVLEEGQTETRNVGYLSAGAVDAAYIALRIALARQLCREKPTFVFDDSFVKMDDERLKNVLGVLEKLSEDYQIVILTCHEREVELLKDRCRVVRLEEENA